MDSVPGRAYFHSDHSFFFFPSFPPLLHFFFPLVFHPFLSSSNFFLPLFPSFPSFFFLLFFYHPFSYLILFLPLFYLSFFPSLFSSPFCCFSFLSFLHSFYSSGCFLLSPSSLFLMFMLLFSFSHFNHFFLSYLFHLFAKGAAIK